MGARARAFLILLTLFSLTACPGRDGSGRTHTVRGQVTQLPDPGNPGTGLYLNHEAIDDFTNRDGEVVGMDPMTMSFQVDEKVPLQDIQVGDYIELDLRVDWGAAPPDSEVEIVRIRKLPPDTRLEFRAARPPQPETK